MPGRPTYHPPGHLEQESRDMINYSFRVLKEGATPIKTYASVGELPTPADYPRCLAIVNTGASIGLYACNGFAWLEV